MELARTAPVDATYRNRLVAGVLHLSYPVFILIAVDRSVGPSVGWVETAALVLLSTLLAGVTASFFRQPQRFLQAVRERLVRPLAMSFAAVLVLFSVWLSLILRGLRLGLALFFFACYAVWPLDLIPDVFFGLGWLDDAGVGMFGAYWALFAARIGVAASLRQYARDIIQRTRVVTQFP